MGSITWKGEPVEGTDDEGPKEMTWMGQVFKRGEAVETDNQVMLQKASTNRYFEVSGYEEPKPADVPQTEFKTYTPPSQQPAQYPVPKPGEPVRPEVATPPVARSIPKV